MIVLTPNRRLSAFSIRAYNAEQELTKRVWESPNILPIEVWIAQLWNQCLDNRYSFYKPVLSGKQQQLLFEQIIQTNNVSSHLLKINSTANTALQAWTFLSQWQIPLSKLDPFTTYCPDVAAFMQWMESYIIWLEANNFVDFNQVVEIIVANIADLIPLLPSKVCLRGFNELVPIYSNLFSAMQDYGIEISHDTLTKEGANVVRVGLKDSEQELQATANWLATELKKDVNQILGVVVPDLVERRDRVVDALLSELPHEWLNISAPKPLSSFGVITTALNILKLSSPVVLYEDFSAVLRSPFIADFNNIKNANALLDRELREQVEAKVTLEHLISLIPDDNEIHSKLVSFINKLDMKDGKHAPEHWSSYIQDLLNCFGWPGERIVNTTYANLANTESDLLSCWQDLLKEYCALDTVLPEHGFNKALQYIWRFAKETPFLPSESGETRVHVLGLLEAEGLFFDKLWVCGMSREQWPSAANPNPFIPREMQRDYDMPHSCAERELLMATKYTANLQQGAQSEVIFSYPKMLDDNQTTASNLIMHMPVKDFKLHQKLYENNELEHYVDDNNLELNTPYIKGGANSLRLQALCPFRANATMRLNARPLNLPAIALTPAMRGNIVHLVLEYFWQQYKCQDNLVQCSKEELSINLQQIITKALEYWQKKLPVALQEYYLQLEASRLFSLIYSWLEYEKERFNFEVYQTESKMVVSVAGIQLNLRIDRIDKVNDEYVIIDYKTGMPNVEDWFPAEDEAIFDPQLPIYAVCSNLDIAGVAFAQLRANEVRFKGIAHDDILPNVKVSDDWEAILNTWQQSLTKTMQEFKNGESIVKPYNSTVCTTCDLQAFCRIYEQ